MEEHKLVNGTKHEDNSRKSSSDVFDSSDEEGEHVPISPEERDEYLKNWLSQDSPELNDQKIDFLLEEDNCEKFLDNITLLNPKVKVPSSYKKGGEMPYRERNHSNLLLMKRSYNSMEILSSTSKFIARLLQTKFKIIVVRLYDIFKYNSDGNFHHFRKLFESLLRFKPIEVFDIILNPRDDNPPLILSMLEFLDESPVSAALGTILFFPLRLTVAETERKKRLNHFLDNYQFIKKIALRMGYSDANAFASSDFLFRIVDECTRVESSDVITNAMEDPSDCLVDWIFEVLFSKSPSNGNAQKTSCFKVLLALLSKSAPKEFEVPVTTGNFYTTVTQKTPNGLANIHEIVKAKIIDKFGALSDLLHEDTKSTKPAATVKFSTYDVKSIFPSMRLGALEVMYEALKDLDDPDALEQIPPNLWKLMITWFFDYKFNNVYHTVFYKIVITVIRSNHVPTLKNLFSKTKFLSKMIECYPQPSYLGCRGYILLICNVLRLMSDSQKPSDYIPMMLISHHTWNDFLPKLRQDTMEQVELQVQDDPSFQRPLPHAGPLCSSQENEDMISFLSRLLKAEDIDLGSQFAYSLGFLGNQADDDPYSELDDEETKKRKKNRKKREMKKKSLLILKSSLPNSPITTSKPDITQPNSNNNNHKQGKLPNYQPPPTYSV